MTDRTDLIAKLKAATEWSKELEQEIHDALVEGTVPGGVLAQRFHYLRSLDAALGTARDQREQQDMLFEAAWALGTSDPGPGETLWTPNAKPLDFFHLCRAAMLVRLGGE